MTLETHIRRKLLWKPYDAWATPTTGGRCVCCRRAVVDHDYRDVCRDCLSLDRLGPHWAKGRGFDNSHIEGLSTPIGELP